MCSGMRATGGWGEESVVAGDRTAAGPGDDAPVVLEVAGIGAGDGERGGVGAAVGAAVAGGSVEDVVVDVEEEGVFALPLVAGGYYTTEIYMNELSSGVYVVNLVTDRETLSFKTGKF